MNSHDISVDFDVFKVIQTTRSGFHESENEVLRRLLGLPPSPKNHSAHMLGKEDERNGRGWGRKDVFLPENTELFLDYQGVRANGRIINGAWEIEGERYRTPSNAAISIVEKRRGNAVSLNGWLYWEVKRPSDNHKIQLGSLRKKIERRRR